MPPRLRNNLLRTAALFFISYGIFLVIWIQIKGLYGAVLLSVVSNVIGVFTHAAYVDVHREHDMFTVVFGSLRDKGRAIPMSINAFTYNMPITLAILAALTPFIKRKTRALVEAVSFLILSHILYVITLETLSFTLENHTILHAINEYAFLFMHKVMTRSEPFIIGAYILAVYVYRDESSGNSQPLLTDTS